MIVYGKQWIKLAKKLWTIIILINIAWPLLFLVQDEGQKIYLVTLVEAWYSLEQYIGLKEDKLSSTTVDFIRSEGNLETKRLYWFSKPKMC